MPVTWIGILDKNSQQLRTFTTRLQQMKDTENCKAFMLFLRHVEKEVTLYWSLRALLYQELQAYQLPLQVYYDDCGKIGHAAVDKQCYLPFNAIYQQLDYSIWECEREYFTKHNSFLHLSLSSVQSLKVRDNYEFLSGVPIRATGVCCNVLFVSRMFTIHGVDCLAVCLVKPYF